MKEFNLFEIIVLILIGLFLVFVTVFAVADEIKNQIYYIENPEEDKKKKENEYTKFPWE